VKSYMFIRKINQFKLKKYIICSITLLAIFMPLFISNVPINNTNTNVEEKVTNIEHLNVEGAGGPIWTVDDDGPADFSTIQDAVDASSNGDIIQVFPGNYVENIVVDKSITIISTDGAPDTIIHAATSETIVKLTANKINVIGFTIMGSAGGGGISLNHAHYCNLTHNVIKNNMRDGITVYKSSYCNISYNKCLENYHGISIRECWGNVISNNICNNNNGNGFQLSLASFNTFRWNSAKMNDKGFQVVQYHTSNIDYWNNDIDETNTVSDKPILYLFDKKDLIIKNRDIGHLTLAHCSNCTVRNCRIGAEGFWVSDGITVGLSENNTIENNEIFSSYECGNVVRSINIRFIDNVFRNLIHFNGIYLYLSNYNYFSGNFFYGNRNYGLEFSFSDGNTLVNNIFDSNSGKAIYFYYSNNNLVKKNKISDNGYGIYFDTTSDNRVFLNDFVNNANDVFLNDPCVWNSYEPISYYYGGSNHLNFLGNYWDKYNGFDVNNDGIGDSPYSFDGYLDDYPLVRPFDNYLEPPIYHDYYLASIGISPPSLSLKADSEFMEIWAADDLTYPEGDYRNEDPYELLISDDMYHYLANKFSNEIYPNIIAEFGKPLDRDGTDTLLEQAGLPSSYWSWLSTENPQKLILKVVNFRDENYYDPYFPYYTQSWSSPEENTNWYNRNMILIDPYRWWKGLGEEGQIWFPERQDLQVSNPSLIEDSIADWFEYIIEYDFPSIPEFTCDAEVVSKEWTRDPTSGIPSQKTVIEYSITNLGDYSLENLELTIKENGIITDSKIIPYISSGEIYTDYHTLYINYDSSTEFEIITSKGIVQKRYFEEIVPQNFDRCPYQLNFKPEEIIKFYITPNDPIVRQTLAQILEESPNYIPEWIAVRDWVANNIDYDPKEDFDFYHHGRYEYFQFPRETILSGLGDCEDFSILLVSLLRANGWSTDHVYTVVGHKWTEFLPFEEPCGHSWVMVKIGFDWYRLDPQGGILRTGIGDALGLYDYTADFLFNDEEIIESPGLITALSPVDIELIDAEGRIVNKTQATIPGASYHECDIDMDGDLDDQIWLPLNYTGEYHIRIIPEANADPLDKYTLYFGRNGTVHTLAEDVLIKDIPFLPYIVEITETEVEPIVQANIDFDPDTLNLNSKGKWVTVYIELPNGHDYNIYDIDLSNIKLNGEIYAESSPYEIGDYDNDGISDLMVKFDRVAVISLLCAGDEVAITITGNLVDGRLFKGTDTIGVISDEVVNTISFFTLASLIILLLAIALTNKKLIIKNDPKTFSLISY